MTWPSPSAAIANGACSVCLGDGITLDIILDRLGPCSGCGGSGALDDMVDRCVPPGGVVPTSGIEGVTDAEVDSFLADRRAPSAPDEVNEQGTT